MLSYRPASPTASVLLNPSRGAEWPVRRRSDQVGEPKRLRPVTANRGSLDEPNRVDARTSGGGRENRSSVGGDGEQSMRAEEGPSGVGAPGEPLFQRRPDSGEFGRPTRHGNDWHAELPVNPVEVQYVEPSDDRSVQNHCSNALEGAETSHERNHLTGSVRPVDPDPPRTNRFHVLWQREGDGGDGGVALPSVEGPVVHADHPGVNLPEGAPQR